MPQLEVVLALLAVRELAPPALPVELPQEPAVEPRELLVGLPDVLPAPQLALPVRQWLAALVALVLLLPGLGHGGA